MHGAGMKKKLQTYQDISMQHHSRFSTPVLSEVPGREPS
jgi:hypothetical protein